MFYANEVGRAAYRVEGDGANAMELALAKMLVDALEAKFEPEKWKDRYEERLKALIESRTPVASAGAPQSGSRQAPVADIMEALRKSLEMARKPVASEQRPCEAEAAARKAEVSENCARRRAARLETILSARRRNRQHCALLIDIAHRHIRAPPRRMRRRHRLPGIDKDQSGQSSRLLCRPESLDPEAALSGHLALRRNRAHVA
jgi:hypothetical protein